MTKNKRGRGAELRDYREQVHLAQPRSQSSSVISDVTSPVKLVENIRAIALGSKPPLVARIARKGLGTWLQLAVRMGIEVRTSANRSKEKFLPAAFNI